LKSFLIALEPESAVQHSVLSVTQSGFSFFIAATQIFWGTILKLEFSVDYSFWLGPQSSSAFQIQILSSRLFLQTSLYW
jgi:hypothetical protein